jgi:predicted RNA-binding protein with RPS1 domain
MLKDIERLKMIALRDKVTTELKRALGVDDPTLSDFLIDCCRKYRDEDEFFISMNKLDECFTYELASNIHFLVRSTFPASTNRPEANNGRAEIDLDQTQEPKQSTQQNDSMVAENGKTANKLVHQFPGLAIKDLNEEEVEIDFDYLKDVKLREFQHTSEMVQKPPREDSADKGKKKKDNKKKSKKEKSKKRSRRRSSSSDSYSSSSSSSSESLSEKSVKPPKALEFGSVYKGRVVRIMSFGLLVQVELSCGSERGLVHISNIRNYHIKDLNDEFKEGDLVYAKFTEKKQDGKLSFSMKNINQQTGVEEISTDAEFRSKNGSGAHQMSPETLREYESYLLSQEYGPLTGVKLEFGRHRRQRKTNDNDPDVWEKTR